MPQRSFAGVTLAIFFYYMQKQAQQNFKWRNNKQTHVVCLEFKKNPSLLFCVEQKIKIKNKKIIELENFSRKRRGSFVLISFFFFSCLDLFLQHLKGEKGGEGVQVFMAIANFESL